LTNPTGYHVSRFEPLDRAQEEQRMKLNDALLVTFVAVTLAVAVACANPTAPVVPRPDPGEKDPGPDDGEAFRPSVLIAPPLSL
jgi:hypothetical protein